MTRSYRHLDGFTLIELIVAISIIALLAALSLGAIGTARQKAYGAVCRNNFRQLQLAWTVYTVDHGDRLPPNVGGPAAGLTPEFASWVSGYLSYSSDPDNTNTLLLIKAPYGSLGPYTTSPHIYKCPSDKSTVLVNKKPHARVRSCSMNAYLGDSYITVTDGSPYKAFKREAQLDDPGPSKVWVFMDEHEDSINDGFFWIPLTASSMKSSWQDLPGARHNGGAVISFADGHVELKRWRDIRTKLPVQGKPYHAIDSPNNPDIAWLQERTSTLK